jgi:predicted outer membrane repeat protein
VVYFGASYENSSSANILSPKVITLRAKAKTIVGGISSAIVMCATLVDDSVQCVGSDQWDTNYSIRNAVNAVKPFLCSSKLAVAPGTSDSLQIAFNRIAGSSTLNTLLLQPGTYTVTTPLVLDQSISLDFHLQGATTNSADTVIDCGNIQPCITVNGAYGVTISGIKFMNSNSNSIRKLTATSSNQGLTFTNVQRISVAGVTLQGFTGTNGAALSLVCSETAKCSDVSIDSVSFLSNTATDYGGAVLLDISVPDTSFTFSNTVFDSNSAGIAGGAVYWQRHAVSTNECTATAARLTFTDTVFTGNTAAQWGNDKASDTCGIKFAVAPATTVESTEQLTDTTGTAAPTLLAYDYYDNTVLAENGLTVTVPVPTSVPVTSSYTWYTNSLYSVVSGSVLLSNLKLGARPESAFTFAVTAADSKRSFSVSYTVHTSSCQPGTYRELTTSDSTLYSCADCLAGTYSDATEKLTCKACAAGTYCSGASTHETACPQYYSSTSGSGGCICAEQYIAVERVTGCDDVAASSSTTECPTQGGTLLTVYGSNFGTGSGK